MNSFSTASAAAILTVATVAAATAGDRICTIGRDCDATQAACGNPLCHATHSREPIKKSCYEIESEFICVPPVRLPWSKHGGFSLFKNGFDDTGCDVCGDANTCNDCRKHRGRVRTVKRLTKHSYECGERCVTKWEVVCGCQSADCGGDSGREPIPEFAPVPEPTPPAPSSPTPQAGLGNHRSIELNKPTSLTGARPVQFSLER